MPTSTIEDYLKAIFVAETDAPGEPVGTGRIAEALGVTPGTATAMVKTLSASKLVRYEPYAGVRLTRAGRELASHVLRRHRLVELFLVQVMGMNWSEVHDEAETLEHAISDRLLERIDEMLGRPAFDPHGDPIPTASGDVAEVDFPSLLTCDVDRAHRVARVLDQSEAFLQLLERHGVVPGERMRVVTRDETADSIVLRADEGEAFNFGYRAAAKVLVEPVAG